MRIFLAVKIGWWLGTPFLVLFIAFLIARLFY
jgi:hypothetical protein